MPAASSVPASAPSRTMGISGALRVYIWKATGLRPAINKDSTSPYVKVSVGGHTEMTRPVQNNLDPCFDWEIVFLFANVHTVPSSDLLFEAVDWGVEGYNETLGNALLPLSAYQEDLIDGQTSGCILEFKDGQATPGQLYVSIKWEPSEQMVQYQPLPPKTGEENDLEANSYGAAALSDLLPAPPPLSPVATESFGSETSAAAGSPPHTPPQTPPQTPSDLGRPPRPVRTLRQVKFNPVKIRTRSISFDRRQTTIRPLSADQRKDGVLCVRISHAKGLKAGDENGLSDPFVRVTAGGHTGQTKAVRNTRAPSFDWDIKFALSNVPGAPSLVITFEVYHWEISSDVLLGTASIPLVVHKPRLAAGLPVSCAIQLEDGQKTPGELFVILSWTRNDERNLYPAASIPPPSPRPPRPPPPPPKTPAKRRSGGVMRVHIESGSGFRKADPDAGLPPLTTFLVKAAVGKAKEKLIVIKDSLRPRFDWTLRDFRFDHLMVATSGSVAFGVDNADLMSATTSLGWGTVRLADHGDAFAAGERVHCTVRVGEGELKVWFEWEFDEEQTKSLPPPASRERPFDPLLPGRPAILEEEPKPKLMIGIFILVPSVTGILAWDAEYSPIAVGMAIVMPIIGILAFLITPLTPPEDPTEPSFPTLENTLPTPLYSLVRLPFDAFTSIKDWLIGNTIGRIMQLVGPVIAPYMTHVAFGIQIYMGLSSLVSAEDGFLHVHRFSAGLLILITTMIQLPDSMGWAFATFPVIQEKIDDFNEHKGKVEGSVVNAADKLMKDIQEIMEETKDAYPGLQNAVTMPDYIKPVYRAICEWLDGIGSITRGSPLKILVVILELTLTVNDFAMPQLPSLPSWQSIMSAASFITGHVPGSTYAWPTYVMSDADGLTSAINCSLGHPCQVLGKPDPSSCNASQSWYPSDALEAKLGITAVFEPKHVNTAQVNVFYTLAAAAGERIAFSMRLELSDVTSAWSHAAHDAIAHWDHDHSLRTSRNLRINPLRNRNRDEDEDVVEDVDLEARVVIIDVITHPNGLRNVSYIELQHLEDHAPTSFQEFDNVLQAGPQWGRVKSSAPIDYEVIACPLPLEIQLTNVNGTYAMLESVHLSIHSGSGHAHLIGLDAIELIGVEDVEDLEVEVELEEEEEEEDVGEDAESDAGGAAEVESEIPVGEIASVTGVAATAAASSDFVRSQVKPDEFAKDKAKEETKKELQLARSGAEGRIRKLLATPLEEVDVGEALAIIEDAEAEGVLPSLIDKAVEHTEKAAQLQWSATT